MRLVSPSPGLHFLGRVEVFHDNQWGTVCDNSFYTAEANVICQMLNFIQGAVCSVSYAQFGQGRGMFIFMHVHDKNTCLNVRTTDVQVQFGWITLNVSLEMRFWKIVITIPGEILVALIMKTLV